MLDNILNIFDSTNLNLNVREAKINIQNPYFIKNNKKFIFISYLIIYIYLKA